MSGGKASAWKSGISTRSGIPSREQIDARILLLALVRGIGLSHS